MYQFLTEIPNDQANSTIPDVTFSPNGKMFAASYKENNKINVYDSATMALIRSYQKPESQLDWPHGLTMTNDHIIVTNKHLIVQPSTFIVYRIENPSEKPVSVFTTPIQHLREAHSIDLNNGRLVAAYCGKGIGAIVSYHFDDKTGVITGPTCVHESKSTFPPSIEPKGICFTDKGEKIIVTLSTEKPSTYIGMLMRALRLLREKDGLKYIAHKALRKFKQQDIGQNVKIDKTVGYYNGLAVYNIDENGIFSKKPIQTQRRSKFSRLENINIVKKSCVIADPINDTVNLYKFDGNQFPESPIEIIQDRLAFPHDACLSPDEKLLVVANYGLKVVDNRPQWGKFRTPHSDKLTIYELS